MTAADRDVRTAARTPDLPARPRGRGRRRLHWAAIASSAVAVLCALALPFAPVSVNDPVVHWPEDPAVPQSTSLLLNAYEPRELDVTLSCAAVRAAAAQDSDDGVVFATLQPEHPDARDLGLVVTAADGRLRIVSAGAQLVDEPLPTGDCGYRIAGDASGLAVSRDGRPVAGATTGELPQIDALITSVDGAAGITADDLSATVRVADPFSHRPATGKVAVLVLLGLASLISLGTLGALAARARADAPGSPPVTGSVAPPEGRGRRAIRPVDVVVVAVMIAWLFLAPATDDDGYYSAMARNVEHEGYVAQYYQLRNQSFTPFTWFYYALGTWQNLGLSPVVLRVPALVAGIITYVLLRVFLSGWLTRQPASGRGQHGAAVAPWIVRGVLAVAFLAWWLPYDMGVRPESMVPALSAGVLVATWSAVRRTSLPRLALALALAAVSCTVHPTGFVALAPLLVATPWLWALVRSGTDGMGTVARLGAVLAAPVGIASALAFVDGTFYDFVRSQEIFLSIQAQNSWHEEIQRYEFLLSQIPMGSYAKRAAVLLGLLSLLWFAVLVAAARARRLPVADELRLAGWSLALGFGLLLITPSKWTHHFGSLAGLGPAFLALFVVSAVPLARRLTEGRRPSTPVVLAALGTTAAVGALSMHGPNAWAYSWMIGLPQAFEIPHVAGIGLDSLALWLLAAAAVTAALSLAASRSRAASWRPFSGVLAAPVLGVGLLVMVVGYLLAGFVYAAASTWNTWSPQASAIRDPLARDCAAGGAVEVADPDSARDLPVVGGADVPVDPAFSDNGWFELSPPPRATAGGDGNALGSLTGVGRTLPGEEALESSLGETTSPWYGLPARVGEDEAVVVSAAGRLGGGNELTVEYGRVRSDGQVDTVASEPLQDGADTPAWRSFALRTGEQLDSGADAVRLVARDGSTGGGGWLAFSAPTRQSFVPLPELIGNRPTAVSWQFAFNFPCAVQPIVQDGITEPVEHGIVWGDQGVNGLRDNTFAEFRGGLFGQLDRSAGVSRLLARVEGRPDIQLLQVYRFHQPLPTDAYELTRQRETVSGLTGPG